MKTIRDVMTTNVVTIPGEATITEAARKMRDDDIGDVVVLEQGRFAGIVTDRDIVVRALAEGYFGDRPVREVATTEVETLTPDASADEAIEAMRWGAVRRVPVVEDGRPVGIVSLGDLAMEREPDSVLGDISEAEPNN